MKIDYIELSTDIQQILTSEQAWHYHIIPKTNSKELLHAYIDKSKNSSGIKNELSVLFGKKIVLDETDPELISKTLSIYYRKQTESITVQKSKFYSGNGDEYFLLNLILEAKQLGSSDIHIENYGEKCRIRIRIDGILIERYIIPLNDYPGLINKIKIQANLDIAEKRLPQDGRIQIKQSGNKFDIRVSILPTLYGEKVVLRILSNDTSNINIESLGMNESDLNAFLTGIKQPNGIILISGPTGSGKTTTLYAALKLLNQDKTNILTVEDPIEYTLPGINQVQVKESIGLTFAKTLKTFLRQDPDIIMLGEIRDSETAQMAIRAALTGHLVLSTIHTNSAWGTVNRLIDMGVPSYLLSSTLKITASQRLVRLLCNKCKRKENFEKNILPSDFKIDIAPEFHFVKTGCPDCHYTGYKGRKAIYEIIPIDFELARQIKTDPSNERSLDMKNITPISINAFQMFVNGYTSAEEIFPLIINN